MMKRFHEDERPRRLPSTLDDAPAGAAQDDFGGANLWTLLNDRLSGRWPHAIALGTCLAIVFAIIGYRMTNVKWDATGIIQVSPKITPLMRDTPETGLTPQFATHIRSEARLVKHPHVLERTLQHMDLTETPWETVQGAMRGLHANLIVDVERNTELIHVSFRAESPALAQRVTNAVLRSYDEVRGSVAGDEHGRKLMELRAERANFEDQRRLKRNELEELVRSTGHGVSDFEPLINQRAQYIETLKAELRRRQHGLEVLIARGGGAAEDVDDVPAEETLVGQPEIINPRELEAYDAELAALGRQRHAARMAYERARDTWTPNHRSYLAAENEYRLMERLYNERAAIVHEEFLASGHMPTANTPADMRMHIDLLEREIQEEQAVLQQMARWQNSIKNLRTELEHIERWLIGVEDRIQELNLEADVIRAGRIRVASYADYPLRPSQDRRRPLAAIGAMGGFGMGVGLFFLLGTLDRRVYVARQITTAPGGGGRNRILGVLPALPQRAGDIEAASVAAHCVHQIRNHIESVRIDYRRPREERHPMILIISSPYQGDGKTSLVMSLGASYATAGSNVVLVDCDLVGKNLTTHSMMSGQPGLREALRTGQVNGSAVPLPVTGAGSVSVLPVGVDPTFGPEMVRRDKLEAVLEQLRAEFDVILVDTGPLFGSIETLPASAAAATFGGGVVLTMQRGRRHARLEECIDEIRAAGANYLGLVLNHARISDCDRYVSKSRISAVISAHDLDASTNGSAKPKPPAPRASRNVLLRAMQVTSRSDT